MSDAGDSSSARTGGLLEDEAAGLGDDLDVGLLLSGDTILDLQFKSTMFLFFVYMGGVF